MNVTQIPLKALGGDAQSVTALFHRLNSVLPVDQQIVAVPPDMLADLVAACDVVVVGVGDCGSCSASAVADGLALEDAGIPAVVVCSDAFGVTADAMAALQGSPGYRYVQIPHPVAPLEADELRQRAVAALPEIVATLTAGHARAAA